MKTLKSIMLGLALVAVCSAANAVTPIATVKTTHTTSTKLSKEDVLNIYVNAALHGKLDGLDDVLSDDVQFNIIRGEHTITANKKQMLAYFKASENVEQVCKNTTTTQEEDGEHMVVKVEMKFDTYTRINTVTITNTGYAWLITKVTTQTVAA